MPSSYTSLLKFELPVQGELSGTWGNVVNTAITTPISQAIAGTTSINVAGTDYTLTNGDGSTPNEARHMFITATGSPGAARNVICPASSKLYVFTNSTSGGFAMTLKTLAGSGIAVPAGQSRLLYCNGTDVVEAVNGFSSISLTTALAATSGGTGQSSFAVGDLLYADTTTTLAKLADVATGNVLRSGGVGVAPAWGKVDLTADVTGTLPAANGGTGGTLPVANGGTGQTTSNAALNALLPSQTSNNNKFLQTDGTNTSWATVDILGTIAAASAGAVGTYAMMIPSPNATFAVGDQTAGSNLRFGGTYTDGSGNTGPVYGGTPSGNWRAMGPTNGGYNFTISLWLRYA